MSKPKDTRTTNGRFQKGTSGNPSGRPMGSRNKATLLAEQMLQDNAATVTAKAISLAEQGNIHAIRLCLERLLPPRRERAIYLELQPVTNAQDLPITLQDILTAVAEGRITPAEAQQLASVLSTHAETNQADDLAQRVHELEEHLSLVRDYRRDLRNYINGKRYES